MDAAGNLYGTTEGGGIASCGGLGCGVVFELAPDGTETVLYSFCSQSGCADGAVPLAGLIMDAAGNLYGTTAFGGTSNQGVVFQLAPDGTATAIANGGPYAAYPYAGLVMDTVGNLYGTTYNGGGAYGDGVVFELRPDPSGTGWTGTVLHSLCGRCGDGDNPQAGLILDAAGNLYGTTLGGGLGPFGGNGVVFKLAPDGTETTLYRFQGAPADGATPVAGLVMDATGNLFGTTQFGGYSSGWRDPGRGVVFKLTP